MECNKTRVYSTSLLLAEGGGSSSFWYDFPMKSKSPQCSSRRRSAFAGKGSKFSAKLAPFIVWTSMRMMKQRQLLPIERRASRMHHSSETRIVVVVRHA